MLQDSLTVTESILNGLRGGVSDVRAKCIAEPIRDVTAHSANLGPDVRALRPQQER